MVAEHFEHVDTWVFDLDNTLYHPSADLFGLMDPKFSAYVMRVTGLDAERAAERAITYWETHGSTLAGLMIEHNVDPHHFLAEVHDINIDHLTPDPDLAEAIGRLPGRKIVYTNGSQFHAKRVLAARGLAHSFDAVFAIEDAELTPKPHAQGFATVFARANVTPSTGAMFEDEERNLKVPHDLGMRTVHVHDTPLDAPHIHHGTTALTEFLSQVVR
ncbi:pyrimidine 5'-nucleotidase [Loktanella sp. S4079]|uniref:pyrimidine 5'-nucleotidase n=1 Tax=Loktanella sp. S4079 TaxID=579483 RepID=UPI0005F9C48E|nr:pyrimidine 5'-nucleotidase [Loktanella sp. S4079]KJZ20482.1 HAD family hydrolase [Loktanella sp. S4079]